MHALHAVDYAILAVYFGLSLVVGLLMTRRASASLDHYFLGGRRLPWWLLGIAGMTGWFDLTGTMIITSFLFMLGPRGLFIEFRGGAVLILAFMLVYAGKWHRRSGCMTGAEWMRYRFGDGPEANAVRVLTAAVGLIWTVGALGYLIRGTTLFMAMMFPLDPLWTTIGVLVISAVYTVAAGFYGVVLTDLLQGIIIVISCVVVSVMAWLHVPDAAALGAVAEQVTGNSQWLSSVPHWRTSMPPGYEQYSFLFLFAAFYLLRNVLGGMGAGGENRYFGARSDRDCGLQSLLQGVTVAFRWPLMMAFAVLGVYLVADLFPDRAVVVQAVELIRAALPDVSAAQWAERMNDLANHPERYGELVTQLRALLGDGWADRVLMLGYNGTVNPEQILPAVMLNRLPVGLKGFLLVAMFAALMSTFTGTVNGASALFVKDIYQNLLRPAAGRRELLVVSYCATIGVVVGGFLMGVAAENINDIWSWLIMGLGSGGLAGILRLYWWRCNAWGMVAGTIVGGLGAVLQRAFLPDMLQWDRLAPTTQAWLSAHLPAWLVRALHMPGEWQAFLVIGWSSLAGLVLVSWLTPPTDRAILTHFYRTTRPFGWWGPIRAGVEPALRARINRENRRDIAAIPFALLAQITLFLLPMQLVIKEYGSFLRTLPLFLLGCAGLYWFWYRHLGAIDAPELDARPAREPAATVH